MEEIASRRRKSDTWPVRAEKAFIKIPKGTKGIGSDFVKMLEALVGEKCAMKSTGNLIQAFQRNKYIKKTGDAIESPDANGNLRFWPEYERI